MHVIEDVLCTDLSMSVYSCGEHGLHQDAQIRPKGPGGNPKHASELCTMPGWDFLSRTILDEIICSLRSGYECEWNYTPFLCFGLYELTGQPA